MHRGRTWTIVGSIALIVIAVQMLSRPPVNPLSVRVSRYEMLDGLWPRSSDLFRYPSWSTGTIEPDTRLADIAATCGQTTELAPLAERVSEATSALRETAQSMYRSEIIGAVVDAVPWWRVKLWHVSFGLGLWDGRLDASAGYLTDARIGRARVRSGRWYARATGQVICDAARAAGAADARKTAGGVR